MAIDFSSLLSKEQKIELLNSRIQQFAAEAYQHELNKYTAEMMEQPELIEVSDAALAQLEKAVLVHQAELDYLSE